MSYAGFAEELKRFIVKVFYALKPVKFAVGEVENEGTPSMMLSDMVIKVFDDNGNVLRLKKDSLILTDAVVNFKTQLSFDDPSIKQKITVREGRIRTKDGSIKANISAPSGSLGAYSGAFGAKDSSLLLTDPYAQFELPDDPEDVYKIEGYLRFTEKVKHEVTVYNGLKRGDKVGLLRVQSGQKYVVLNRIREPGGGGFEGGVFV